MNHFGIQYEWVGSQIRIAERAYKPTEFTVEADWSGASYWYEILALAGDGEIFLENLRLESLQGDARIAGWFTQFGISSEQKESGVLLSKIGSFQLGILILDFIENPDIAQTMACICVVRGIPFHFYGLKTLKIKETDRITALQNELSKFGANLTEPAQGELAWDGTTDNASKQTIPVISTYHDHRMALAFAPMALVGVRLRIDDPMVVTKSYPGFWSDLIKVGFTIE